MCADQYIYLDSRELEKEDFIFRILNEIFRSFPVNNMLSVSYCMVCAYVWEDNPLAKARGLSSTTCAQTIQKLPYCTSMHVHFLHGEIFDVEHWNLTHRCNKIINWVIILCY